MESAVVAERNILEVMDDLEARGAAMVGAMNAAAAGLVAVISDALVTEAWQGFNSPEHWVGLRFGLGPHRARRFVAAARALTVLPECRAAYAAGELSEDHVAAIVQAKVQPRNDREATELARHATVGQLRRGLRGLPREPDPPTDDDADDGRPPAGGAPDAGPEHVHRGWRDDGRYRLSAVLDPLTGALVDKAIDAALDKLWRGRDGGATGGPPITVGDAVAHVAGLALDAMDPATAANPDRTPSMRWCVMVHVDGDDPERIRLHLGPWLPRELLDQLLCDAYVRLWRTTAAGTVDLGRTRRTADAKLRTVVEHRDEGCGVGGCERTHGLHIHHIDPWPAGGPTDLSNLVALCPPSHRLVHRGHIVITRDPVTGAVRFTDARGRPLTYEAPPPATDGDPPVPPSSWANRRGDRADWSCMTWTEPPRPPPDDG